MKNLNSKGELFEGKKIKVYDYSVHYKMPKVKLNNARKHRRTAYKGIKSNDKTGYVQ